MQARDVTQCAKVRADELPSARHVHHRINRYQACIICVGQHAGAYHS